MKPVGSRRKPYKNLGRTVPSRKNGKCKGPEAGTRLVCVEARRKVSISSVVVVQSPSHVRLFATPWTVACQASLSLLFSRTLPKFISVASVMPSSHPLHLLMPSSPSALSLSQPQGLFQCKYSSVSSAELLSHVCLFVAPWTAAHQASLSITNSQSLRKLMSIESVMPSNHLIFCRPLLLPPSIFPSIRVFSNESVLRIRWPTCWSFSFSISPSSESSGLISFRMDWLDLLTVQGTLKRLLQHHSSKASILRQMATHSSILSWRILGTEEPGGLLSMG